MARSTAEVLDTHLQSARTGSADNDVSQNFAEDCVLLTTYGRFEGHEGVKAANALLMQQIPNAKYDYAQKAVAGEMGFLEWTGEGDGVVVGDGADSYLIRDGRIQVMTIHYTVQPK